MEDPVGGKAGRQEDLEDLAGAEEFLVDQGLLALEISEEIDQLLTVHVGFGDHKEYLDLQEGAQDKIIEELTKQLEMAKEKKAKKVRRC